MIKLFTYICINKKKYNTYHSLQNVLYVSKRFGKLTLDLGQAFKDNIVI